MGDEINDVVTSGVVGGVMKITLNRPDNHNALNPEMIQGLKQIFQNLDQNDDVRVVVLTGAGRSFCAGADLAYMRETSDYSFQDNVAEGESLFDLMQAVDECSKPVIGRINGTTIGGGLGLISCCDITIAVSRAKFGFSETRLGLVPAVISPFVLAKIGPGNGRELYLTAERFDAVHAQKIGLINHVVEDEAELDSKVQERLDQLLLGAPGALAAAKELIRTVAYPPKEMAREYTARLLALRRASEEGREGMSSFLEKRKPSWQ